MPIFVLPKCAMGSSMNNVTFCFKVFHNTFVFLLPQVHWTLSLKECTSLIDRKPICTSTSYHLLRFKEILNTTYSVIGDLDKLKLVMVWFYAWSNFRWWLSCSKKKAHVKSGQKWHKNNYIFLPISGLGRSLIHSVV